MLKLRILLHMLSPMRAFALIAALFLALPAAAQSERTGRPFDYYLLALSWSPEYCASEARDRADPQCRSQPPKGLVVHGLWPQYEDGGWPSACQPANRLPERLIERLGPAMPSPRLAQHEWNRHGTCSGLDMDAYADAILNAFAALRLPDTLRPAPLERTIRLIDLKRQLAQANPGLDPAMIAVACTPRGVELKEIRICLDKRLAFRRCGAKVRDHCPQEPIHLRPTR